MSRTRTVIARPKNPKQKLRNLRRGYWDVPENLLEDVEIKKRPKKKRRKPHKRGYEEV